MLGTLWILLPLLISAVLLMVWAAIILVIVARWVLNHFQSGKTVPAIIVLLALFALPAVSGLLAHSFFRGDTYYAASTGEASILSELVDRLIDGKPAAAARDPWALSDEELIALAQESYPDMEATLVHFLNGTLLPREDEYLSLTDPSGETVAGGYRIKKYKTLEKVCEALDKAWFEKFAHGGMPAPSERIFAGGIYAEIYTEYDGAVYAWEGSVNGRDTPMVVDGLVSRDDKTAVFQGYWETAPDEVFNFSLIFEDGRWKYGVVRLD